MKKLLEDLGFDPHINKGCSYLAVMFFGFFALLMLLWGVDVFNPLEEPSAQTTSSNAQGLHETCPPNWQDYAVAQEPVINVTTSIHTDRWLYGQVDPALKSIVLTELSSEAVVGGRYAVVLHNNRATIVDLVVGDIIAYGLDIQGGISYRAENSLFIINPGVESVEYDVSGEFSQDYYVIRNHRMTHLCSIPAKKFPKDQCDAHVQIMLSSKTGQKKQISGSCEMPTQNWQGQFILPNSADSSYWEAQ